MEYLLQHLLNNSAKASPAKTAVVCGNETITYAELDEASNRLAISFVESGVVSGDRIGIQLRKGIASIISIFGILKAGAAYVPLDPSAPPDRSKFIIQDCGLKHLITSKHHAKALSETFGEKSPLTTLVLTDTCESFESPNRLKKLSFRDVISKGNKCLSSQLYLDSDLAYILYTSGSTGTPKGVVISHLNSLTFVKWACKIIDIKPYDIVSNHAPLHFDLSIFDIFATIKAGATLMLVPEELSAFPYRLADWIDSHRVSIWYSVPSVLTSLVTRGKLERYDFAYLKTIIFAGEVFPVKYLRKLMKVIPRAQYYNFYGPTETNVITYYKVVTAPSKNVSVPIGKACDNIEVFVLTEDGKILDHPGQIGELFARGPCVALGYWGDQNKTKECFVPNPLKPDLNELVYRTGDIVTIDTEGNYLFMGRKDQMVKSRGYRIELGEIEAILYQHPDVREVAVVAEPDELVTNRIKAIVVSDRPVSGSELQRFCLKKLPRYMVPGIIEMRRRLPRTQTGKIDKRSLYTAGD